MVTHMATRRRRAAMTTPAIASEDSVVPFTKHVKKTRESGIKLIRWSASSMCVCANVSG